MQALARAKQASREIFGASEDLLKAPLELVGAYQQEGGAQRYYVWGAILSTMLALAGLLLLGKLYVDDSLRRAVESERREPCQPGRHPAAARTRSATWRTAT